MPRNFGICVGHQDEGSRFGGKISVVKDFLDVFPEELPGLPSDKENEFGIDVPQLFQKSTIGWRKFEDEFS